MYNTYIHIHTSESEYSGGHMVWGCACRPVGATAPTVRAHACAIGHRLLKCTAKKTCAQEPPVWCQSWWLRGDAAPQRRRGPGLVSTGVVAPRCLAIDLAPKSRVSVTFSATFRLMFLCDFFVLMDYISSSLDSIACTLCGINQWVMIKYHDYTQD